jgi:hypothetical protein
VGLLDGVNWGYELSGGLLNAPAPERDLGPAEWVDRTGWRRSYTDAKGNRVQRALTPGERTSLPGASLQEEKTRIARDFEKDAQGRLEAQHRQDQAESNRRFDQDYGIRLKTLEGQIESTKAQGQAYLKSLENQGKQLDNANTIAQGTLTESTNARVDATNLRTQELGLQRHQLEMTNLLNEKKLLMEDHQFNQQLENDQRNSRRTQVQNALTLIAQSAAKF